MPVRGLSNQWKTLDGLLERFAPAGEQGKWRRIRQLLELLDARSGPMIYVGTSHSTMNFSNRDVLCDDDRTQPFANVNVLPSCGTTNDYCYRVETRRVSGSRATTDWLSQDFANTETVVNVIVDAFAYAYLPPKRSRNTNKG